jgi:hypothetical protein
MSDEKILDLTKLAKQKRREARTTKRCEHEYKLKRDGTGICQKCGDRDPCKACDHAECIVRRAELGIHEDPRPWGRLTEQRGPLEVVIIDTFPDDPIDWVWPVASDRKRG